MTKGNCAILRSRSFFREQQVVRYAPIDEVRSDKIDFDLVELLKEIAKDAEKGAIFDVTGLPRERLYEVLF